MFAWFRRVLSGNRTPPSPPRAGDEPGPCCIGCGAAIRDQVRADGGLGFAGPGDDRDSGRGGVHLRRV